MSEQKKIISLLEQNEIKVGELYTVFKEKFNNKDFWYKIAEDEHEHAYWLNKLSDYLKNKEVYFDENRFSKDAIISTTEYIEDLIKEAKNDKINSNSALSLALDIEKSLIEKEYFKVYESDLPLLKNTFQDLKEATEIHIKRVSDQLEKIRS